MELTYLPISHNEIPCRKSFDLFGKNYLIDFDYNERGDFYTMAIRDSDGVMRYSSKLTYLSNVINGPVDGLDLEARIIPVSLTDIVKEYPLIEHIGKENFDSMRICVA